MKTEKKCKGTGKAIGYGCGKMIPVSLYGTSNRTYGLGHNCKCYPSWLFESKEGQKKVDRSIIKASKDVKTEKRRETRKEKDSIKNWKKCLQTKVQFIARLIDKDLPCLARQKKANQFHGGHVLSKGGNPEMRFNLHNIHRQSAQSNTFYSDDALMQEGIIREYGMKYLVFIKELKGKEIPKFSNEEYHKKYKIALKIINALKKENRTFDVEERIELRNRFNFELGIYDWERSQYLDW